METIVRYSDEYELRTRIDKLRDILNELCCNTTEIEAIGTNEEMLILSRQLDELIVKYMVLKTHNTDI
ncbi:aspartyl-phosphate phosphatase Spo0E family protein [Clostridium lacusfryxellense]|uniref:aspartyl-phosphate phosphatase Spo0E family protein n=1 Tax=Clostridium lacusfryxellense TaxID=205328 RepID=UPI001C0BB1FC|nr:aspartyl-phosphate phosphatase Spo0E family protein [Clostridium lacusfryxellense]MBU3112273.1 aspartyl-phosphate phosphatase Spo0E family protein [Clostridium lacusfryxellense]